MSKAQCKALATVAHDGITRAVFPSHTTFDGDLIFSVSTGEKELEENGVQKMALPVQLLTLLN